jgi:hypothetical protein
MIGQVSPVAENEIGWWLDGWKRAISLRNQ